MLAVNEPANYFASLSVDGEQAKYKDSIDHTLESFAGLYMGFTSDFAEGSDALSGLVYDLVGAIVYESTGYKAAESAAKRSLAQSKEIEAIVGFTLKNPGVVTAAALDSISDTWDRYQEYKAAGKTYEAYYELGKLSVYAIGAANAARKAGQVVLKQGTNLYKVISQVASKSGKITASPSHLAEMAKNGVKFTSQEVLFTRKTQGGKVVFLEKGYQMENKGAGLEHILFEHKQDFANKGIPEQDIVTVLYDAVSKDKINYRWQNGSADVTSYYNW